MRETIKLCSADLNETVFKNVMFLSLAEDGAMGEPGEVCFYVRSGEAYHFNYIWGDVDMRKVEKLFPLLSECVFGMFGLDSEVPQGWNYVNLGMGNHLIVNDAVYGRFMELLGAVEESSVVYGKWRGFAEQIFVIN